jgi:hypothetical protein
MTKKHFEAAAAQVRGLHNRLTAQVVAREFAQLFATFQPNFDRKRFFAACGVEL